MNAKQAKRNRRDDVAAAKAGKGDNAANAKAAKTKAADAKTMTAAELAKVNAGQDWRAGGGAWRVGQPYIEDYSTGWVSGSARDRNRD